jgi:hypothetical protein
MNRCEGHPTRRQRGRIAAIGASPSNRLLSAYADPKAAVPLPTKRGRLARSKAVPEMWPARLHRRRGHDLVTPCSARPCPNASLAR